MNKQVSYQSKKQILENKRKVIKLLEKLNLTPTQSVDRIIRDKTRVNCALIVKSKQNNKLFFIKVRLFDDSIQDQNFVASQLVGALLNAHPEYLISKHTPILINSDDDFLLYEILDAESINLGSRVSHDLIKANIKEAHDGITLISSILSINPETLDGKIRRYDTNHLRYMIFDDYGFDKKQLLSMYSRWELEMIQKIGQSVNLATTVDLDCKFLTHGDFQWPNLMRTRGTVFVVDWDTAGIGTRFYDFVKLYNHSYRKPAIQRKIISSMNELCKSRPKLRLVMTYCLLSQTFLWTKVMASVMMSEHFYKRKDARFIKIIHEQRVINVKKYVSKLINYI